MSKHTPGPWNVAETRLNYDTVIRGTKSEPIALVQIAGYSKSEGAANAKLIAAAPLMLNALRLIMAGVAGCDKRIDYVLAREAITKATGEQL